MKILIVRFSSIGDIVLTSAVIQSIAENLPETEIHFLTKAKFSGLIENFPKVHKTYAIDKSINEVIASLKSEKYDHIIDLHHNLRTFFLKRKLSVPASSFNKLNFTKWSQVRLKRSMEGSAHVVDRYLETLQAIGIHEKKSRVIFQIQSQIDVQSTLQLKDNFYVLAIGAQFATKQIPTDKIVYLIDRIKKPVVLIGGEMDVERAENIRFQCTYDQVFNACGKFNLNGSASIIQQSKLLITGDTGMMHIASAFDLPIITVWGNTVPAFGMYPYRPENPKSFSMHEVKDLSCRPCSKIGFKSCPKKHFSCMNDIHYEDIVAEATSCF